MKGFVEGWNNHKVRTAGYKTPNQLFVEGSLQLHRSGLTAVDFFEHVDATYGSVDDGVLLEESDEQGIPIPQSDFVLQEDHYDELRHSINPLHHSDSYGVDLYQTVLGFLYEKIRSNPDTYGEVQLD